MRLTHRRLYNTIRRTLVPAEFQNEPHYMLLPREQSRYIKQNTVNIVSKTNYNKRAQHNIFAPV